MNFENTYVNVAGDIESSRDGATHEGPWRSNLHGPGSENRFDEYLDRFFRTLGRWRITWTNNRVTECFYLHIQSRRDGVFEFLVGCIIFFQITGNLRLWFWSSNGDFTCEYAESRELSGSEQRYKWRPDATRNPIQSESISILLLLTHGRDKM